MQAARTTSTALAPSRAERGLKLPLPGSAAVLACGAVLLVLHARNALDSDEGVILNGAWNLLHGRALYTDFFEFLAPGSFYLVLAAWKVFGSSFWVAKGLALAAIAVATAGIDRIVRELPAKHASAAGPALAIAPVLLFCFFTGYLPTINHNTLHLPFAVWGAFLAIRGARRMSWRHCAAAGFLCGIGAWFLQHRSALIAAATLCVLLLLAWRRRGPGWAKCCAAYAVGAVGPVAVMTAFWDAGLLFEHLIAFPAARYLEVNRIDPTLIACAASLALGAAWLLRSELDASACLLLALLGALLLTALQRPDLSHVTSALWPLLCLLPRVASTPARTPSARLWRTWVAAGLAALPVPLLLTMAANPALYLNDWTRHPALQYVRDHCPTAASLYAGPFAPGLYFETGKLNPTRYSVLLPNFNSDAQFRDALRDLQQSRPACAITNYPMVTKFSHTRDNPVDAYLAANYEVVFEARHRQVWMARTEAAPAKPPVAATPAGPAAAP